MTRSDGRPLVLLSGLADGGAERVTVSFIARLRATGTNVSLCTVTARRDGALAHELLACGVPRHNLDARQLADLRALVRLVRLLRHERPTVVHAHGQDAAILGAVACRLEGVPLVVTRHVLDEPAATRRDRYRARAVLAALRRAHAVVAVSRAVADRLAAEPRIDRKAVHVIHNGIELSRFDRPRLGARRELRAALSPGGDCRLVLVPAVLRPGKGHEVLLRALPALRSRTPAVRFLFAGGGEREAALRRAARGLESAVEFLGPRDDIPDLLAACDLVVLPSLAEGLPTALIEAAAAGRAVVATRVGGVPEIVADGESGLLVPPSDPAALAYAIEALLLDGQRTRAFGAAGRRIAHERFDVATQASRTVELWDSVARRQLDARPLPGQKTGSRRRATSRAAAGSRR